MITRTLAFAALIGVCSAVHAQDWNTGGNFISLPAQYLGCDALSTQPLRLITKAGQPIEFHTNDVLRSRLYNGNSISINGFAGINQAGFWGVGRNATFFNAPNVGPFSRLHLADIANNAQQWGYRPWQRNGINITGNNDQMYVGHKYTYANPTNYLSGELLDYSDAVIQWSDNPGTWLGDRMRFIFTSSYSAAATTGPNSLEGLEGMRLKPAEGGTEIMVGIGDFFAGGDTRA